MRAVLALAFLAVPLAEIFVLIQVGQVIGPWWTVLLLVAMSVLGAWLVRREARTVWRGLQDAIRSGRMPQTELLDAGLVVVGGTLLLTPGFLSDVLGFAMLLPLTRPLFRRLLLGLVTRRVQAASSRSFGPLPSTPSAWFASGSGRRGGHQVVVGEVADDDPA